MIQVKHCVMVASIRRYTYEEVYNALGYKEGPRVREIKAASLNKRVIKKGTSLREYYNSIVNELNTSLGFTNTSTNYLGH